MRSSISVNELNKWKGHHSLVTLTEGPASIHLKQISPLSIGFLHLEIVLAIDSCKKTSILDVILNA